MYTYVALLADLRAQLSALSEKYLNEFAELHKQEPDNDLLNYARIINRRFPNDQMRMAGEILEKAIDGVDDRWKLMQGIQDVKRDTANELREKASGIMARK